MEQSVSLPLVLAAEPLPLALLAAGVVHCRDVGDASEMQGVTMVIPFALQEGEE
jgi:hypothetical protein